ncbi:MAG: IS4 family transposase, partial [Myxococcales bacterium]|nr:IS4 family transposase [Myxococcales bacterium]
VSALLALGVQEQRRGGKLPPARVFLLLLHLALDRDSSIRAVLNSLALGLGFPASWRNKTPHGTSIAQARDRLGWEPVRDVFRAQKTPQQICDVWRGRSVVALDGACLRAPRSIANRAGLGEPSASLRTASHPLLRTVLAVGVYSHWVYEAAFAPYRKQQPDQKIGEPSLARSLLGRLPADAIVVGDRGFANARFLSAVRDQGLDFVVRALKNGKSFKLRKVESLPDGSDLVRLRSKSGDLLLRRIVFGYRTRRVVPKKIKKGKAYERKRKQGETTRVTLVTSLLEPERYPGKEVAGLYRDRWEVEHVFKELKVQLGAKKPVFRGQTPTRVLQEAYATLIVHRCLWANAARAAERASVPALRMSFEICLRLTRTAARLSGPGLASRVLDLLACSAVLPKRRDRHYPREVLALTPKYRVRKVFPANAVA